MVEEYDASQEKYSIFFALFRYFEDHNDFIRCADIHMEREYGLTRKDDKE